jgi:hypothetical protein
MGSVETKKDTPTQGLKSTTDGFFKALSHKEFTGSDKLLKCEYIRWSRKHEDIWGWHDGGLIHHITCKLGIEIDQIKMYVNIAP